MDAPSRARAVARGSLGFAAVSVAAFAVWAFAGRAFKGRSGEVQMYALITVVFLGLSGLVLHPLVRGPRPLLRFHKVFLPAFLLYAAAWCAAWFPLRFGRGEWLGSLAGSVVFAAVTGVGLGNLRPLARVAAVLFVAHSAGYFLGGELFYAIRKQAPAPAMLGWGLLYGLGFGAGLGYAFFEFQKEPPKP